jgi:hypothetical protein
VRIALEISNHVGSSAGGRLIETTEQLPQRPRAVRCALSADYAAEGLDHEEIGAVGELSNEELSESDEISQVLATTPSGRRRRFS